MVTLAVLNQKGGTGKTTTTANLGAALASLGKKILLIDLDPQANLSYSFGINSPQWTMSDVLQEKKPLKSILIQKENLFVAPSSPTLADVEVSLVNKIGRERVLKKSLAPLKEYDYIFIDCPPSLSVLTINALNASSEVLIPSQMEALGMHGLGQLLDTLQEVRQVLNKNLKIKGIIPSMYNSRRRLSKEVLKEIQSRLDGVLFKTRIRECVKIAEAPSFAKTVLSYAGSSSGAEDFMKLAKEFIQKKGVKCL